MGTVTNSKAVLRTLTNYRGLAISFTRSDKLTFHRSEVFETGHRLASDSLSRRVARLLEAGRSVFLIPPRESAGPPVADSGRPLSEPGDSPGSTPRRRRACGRITPIACTWDVRLPPPAIRRPWPYRRHERAKYRHRSDPYTMRPRGMAERV